MSITLATTATQFLQRQGLAKSTLRSYEQILLPLLKKYGHWPVELLDSQMLSEYLLEITHLSYTTHNHHQTVINALLNFIEELRALMGHKSITTTLRYQKVTSQKAEIAAQKAFQL